MGGEREVTRPFRMAAKVWIACGAAERVPALCKLFFATPAQSLYRHCGLRVRRERAISLSPPCITRILRFANKFGR
jgi:hypothetical protein